MFLVFLSDLVQAATLRGTIYNESLEPEKDVLIEVNSQPIQKFLAKEGVYTLELSPGRYQLTAKKSFLLTTEKVNIITEGKFLLDLFLLPDFSEEEELWNESETNYLSESLIEENFWEETKNELFGFGNFLLSSWSYLLLGLIFLLAIYHLIKTRIKYGPLSKFRKRIQEETKKPMEQVQEELKQELAKQELTKQELIKNGLAPEDNYLEQAFKIIQKHDGRIYQKELRREMLYLSEAKISLILTELEHQGRIEKIKKGRGNVIILKQV
jgi:uncharacterized membrane protein